MISRLGGQLSEDTVSPSLSLRLVRAISNDSDSVSSTFEGLMFSAGPSWPSIELLSLEA